MVQIKEYSFNEAMELTGKGFYNVYLLVTLCLISLSISADMFGLSAIVQLASCDFQLDLLQKSILISLPFIGTIITAYPWGYISDTQGRKLCLIVGLPVGFLLSTLSAFSPNWIIFGVLRLIGYCFSASGQSVIYALLGESCPNKLQGKYVVILSSFVQQIMPVAFGLSYLIGYSDFTYDLGYIMFKPWRLYAMILALPMGIATILLLFVYESPKFLLNAGKDEEALNILRNIHRRNHNKNDIYPVKKLMLNEEGSKKEVTFLRSLVDQILPLFKPPLVGHLLLLFYILGCIYGVPSGLLLWTPFISKAVNEGSPKDFVQGLCSIIKNSSISDTNTSDDSNCQAVELSTTLVTIISFNIYFIISFIMSAHARRRRFLVFIFIFIAACSCISATFIPNKAAGIVYFGVFITGVANGPVFSYYVDLFPTSLRGMATCLGLMVARLSNLVSVNLVGTFITTNCKATFYGLAAFFIGGVLLTLLLPPDKDKDEQTKL